MLASLCFASLLGVSELNQHFSGSCDTIFVSSSIGSMMVFLSLILCFFALLATPEEGESESYKFCIIILCLVLIMCFSSSNVMMFYVFFEISLIPTLVLILGWGYQPERLQAGTYMMLYTVSASLPLLVMLLWQGADKCTFHIPSLGMVSDITSSFLTLFIISAFLFKLPMYGAHLWLPKAHVEAPLAGSMILAGILLKLGGFGLFLMSVCFNLSLSYITIFICSLSMWGGFMTAVMCLRQVDVKALVAYSSVGHMSIVVTGFILGSSWGYFSAVCTMVAHGLSSSALFCLAYFTYKKSHTRSMIYIKGLLVAYPVLSLWWFLFCCINMACPPTLDLVGELTAVPVLWNHSIYLASVLGGLMFLGAAYNMFLYSSLNHGPLMKSLKSGTEMKTYCMLVLFIH
uniref:NADH-ubiquinone oxidoreductase chain 4 n=1 Tax=Pleurobranchaea novaezealandiae TaxID=1883448 RepID=A0A1C9M3J1_9GAST|nr:NADH dehydrogenase subunit 4 [Pleurobranchaea novaezealandiae]